MISMSVKAQWPIDDCRLAIEEWCGDRFPTPSGIGGRQSKIDGTFLPLRRGGRLLRRIRGGDFS